VKTLTIKKNHEERLLRGHPWVFSNEVAEAPKAFRPGELVQVITSHGALLGTAYVNPRSLILARLVAAEKVEMDAAFFRERIAAATERRARLLPGVTSCRLVYSEGDGLSGLIVDRYEDQLVVQTHTLGMEMRLPAIRDALVELLSPRAIVERNESPARALEGLEPRSGILAGETDGRAFVQEGESRIGVDLLRGQKTGFFFDQRDNRDLLRGLVEGQRVLDLFCYVGPWSLAALRFGARETLGVDSSTGAIALARENAERNGVAARARWQEEDVETALERLAASGERFGVVVLDPPAYVKSRKKLFAGLRKYRTVNERAMALVERGGFLVTSSCSYHAGADEFAGALAEAARHARRRAEIVRSGRMPADHPIPIGMREAEYLKCFVLEVR
jgi:23S rRNA (cytosine1962-C5)-methyltransferase